MSQSQLFAPEPLFDVKRGDMFALGRHKMMCGDATSKADVAKLFAGAKPTLVVTSPPYADCREYNDPIPCWDTMMLGAFDGHDFADDVQMLINLGVTHRKGQYVSYWEGWLRAMREKQWRHHAQYIWHKTNGLPQAVKTRLTTNYEYIFHLNQMGVDANPCRRNSSAGKNIDYKISRQRYADGSKAKSYTVWDEVAKTSIENAVLSMAVLHPKERTEHPAQYPTHLPVVLIRSFKKEGCTVYDPFLGSGTTILAAEAENVVGMGMEVSSEYCATALQRWQKEHPALPIKKVL